MAEKLKVFTLDNLSLYDSLIKNYVDTADAKSLKTVAIDGNVLKFYRVSEPVGDTAPAYEITLPETDISGLLQKLTGATAGNVVIANADGTVADGGVALANLATDTELKAVSDKVDAIENVDTGILATAKTYTDEEVKELADGAVKTNTDAIAAINNAETGILKQAKDYADGKVATTQGEVDALEQVVAGMYTNTQIDEAIEAAKTSSTYDDTAIKADIKSNSDAIDALEEDLADAITDAKVTMTTDTTTEGYLKTYTLKQGETEIGKIDIAKDLVVTAGEVVTDPTGQPEGTYVKLTIANQDDPVYINVKDLCDAYTAEAGAAQVQVAISDTNEISATIVAGSIGTSELADSAVTTAKIADANVTAAKLSDDAKALFDAAGSAKALEDGQVKTNKEAIATLQGLVGDGYEAITEAEIRALFD